MSPKTPKMAQIWRRYGQNNEETISPSFLGHLGCSWACFKQQKKPWIHHRSACGQPWSSLPMIVHRYPIYRRSAMPTIGSHPLNGQVWTCSAKYSRYWCFMISHSHFLTSLMQHLALAQQAFPSEHVSTVFHVVPTIEFLLTFLEAAEKQWLLHQFIMP